MSKRRALVLFGMAIILILPFVLLQGGDGPAVLSLREREAVVDSWLKTRLEKVLPELMREQGFDMWLVICREYNEDPVFLTLVPYTSMAARRLTILAFFDMGEEGVERLAVSRYGIGDYYKAVWDPEKTGQWECLAQVVRERNPKRIGINESETFAFGDGLTAFLKDKLFQTLGKEYASRLHSAENLAVRWLETRSVEELEVYPYIVAIAHNIISEAFSRKVITPGVSTTEDVVWWIRERICGLHLRTWFQPSVSIQRPKDSPFQGSVIHKGDLLHCDIGITYLGLNSDTQEHAYVLRENEDDVPLGLKDALKMGNRLQDILSGEFKAGRTGNEILASALAKAKSEGLKPSIYSHPLGYHGHAAGPTIGLWDKQGGVPGNGDYPLYLNTCYSIELNIQADVPEWGGKEVRIALEQDAAFTMQGVRFLDGRQTKFYLIQ